MTNNRFKLEALFSDNMVLPVGKAFRIGGQGPIGATVSVKVNNQVQTTTVDKQGQWVCQLAPVNDSRTVYTLQATCGTVTQCVQDIRFGRVILLSGQSNIEYQMKNDHDFKQMQAGLDLTNAFFYAVPQVEAISAAGVVKPAGLAAASWQPIDQQHLGELSAIGFYALLALIKSGLEMPIGLVSCYKGGTSASSWLPATTLTQDAALTATFIKPFEQAVQHKTANQFTVELADYQSQVTQHNLDLERFIAANPTVSLSDAKNQVGHTPWPPPMTPDSFLRPSGLYQTMTMMIQHYTFDQVVWYQGENDAPQPTVYEKLLVAVITEWRQLLADRTLPYYIVQLPKYADEPHDAWAQIRQAQLKVTQKLSNVHLISITDTGEEHNIHPSAKRVPGMRIGRIMAGNGYSDTPVIADVIRKGLTVELTVNAAQQLTLNSPCDFEYLQAGHWLKTRVIQVGPTHLQVAVPEETQLLRYGYANCPTMQLFNENTDPVAPFVLNLQTKEFE